MTTYHIGKPLSDGLVRYSSDGSSQLVQTFSDYVDKTTSFERSFFDSGHYKLFFHQMLLAMVFSVTKQQWSSQAPQLKIYFRSLGDEAVRIIVSSLEKKKRKVHSLTFFMGRMEDKPSKKKFTGLHAKDEHFVDNFKSLLRTLTKEEYEALRVKMLEKEDIDLDTIPIFCTEYSIHPKSLDDGRLSPKISYLSSKFEMDVENRKNIVENLRNEPLSILSEVNFHFATPIINNKLKRPNILKKFNYQLIEDENREILNQESITKIIEEFYSLYHGEFPQGELTTKLPKEGLYPSNYGLCGFLFGVLGNLRTTFHTFFENPKVQYNFDGKNEFLMMTFVDIESFILKKVEEKPLVIDFSASESFGFLKYNFLKQIHNHLTPTIRLMRPTMNQLTDDIKLNMRLVKAPMPFNLFSFLIRQTSNNKEKYAEDIKQAIRSLTHSISLSADLMDKKLEYVSAYLYGLLKTSNLKPNTALKAGLLRNANPNDKHLVNFLLEAGHGMPILISFSNIELSPGQPNTDNFEPMNPQSPNSPESILHVKVKNSRKGSSPFKFDLVTETATIDILETYDFRPITPIELVETFHRGPVRNYVYLNAIHPAQLVGFHSPLQPSVTESEFDEYGNEDVEEKEPNAKKLKMTLSRERQMISNKLKDLFDGAEHVVKNKLSFAAMVDGMFASIPKLKNKFVIEKRDNLQRQLTLASFSQEKVEELYIEGTNIQFHILDDHPIETPGTDNSRLSQISFDLSLDMPSASRSRTSPSNFDPSGLDPGWSTMDLFSEAGRISPTLVNLENMDFERIVPSSDYHQRLAALQTSFVPRHLTSETVMDLDDLTFDEWRDPNEREPSSDESQSSYIPENEEQSPAELALENLKLLTDRTNEKLKSESDIQVQLENIISFVFDTRGSSDERITIAANNDKFNTENVKQFCGKRSSQSNYRRVKRKSLSSMLCSQGKQRELLEDTEKVDFDEKLLENQNIDTEVVKSTRKLSKVCSALQSWVIGRDIMGDVINGDWTGVIRDGAFLGGMILSEKLGTLIIEKGISNLKIEKPLMDSLLHSLTPCVPKLGFDAFMGYNMYEAIRRNDTVDAALDGIVLGADGSECIAEALMAFDIIAATPIVGEIAMGLVTLSLVASSVYDSYHKVDSIQSLLPLRDGEASSEFWRALFHIHSEPLIALLENEKDANKRIIQAILEKNVTSRWFITPSGRAIKGNKNQMVIDYQQNNIVNLNDRTRRPAATRAVPDDTEKYHLSCKMAEKFEKVEKGFWDKFFEFFHSAYEHVKHVFVPYKNDDATEEDYFCVNAFVVEITANKLNSNEAVYATHTGHDSIIGYPLADNVFLIGDGRKLIHGGNEKDTFLIFGKNITGTLDGYGGHNVLDFSNNAATGLAVFEGGVINYLAIGTSHIYLKVNNISEVRGRKNYPDSLSLNDCTMKIIDLKGGDDQILVSRMDCSSNLTVYLTDSTNVYQYNEKGTFNYIVQNMAGNKILSIAPKSKVKLIFSSLASFDSRINYSEESVIITENRKNDADSMVAIHGSSKNLNIHFIDNALLTFHNNHAKLNVNSTDPLNTILFKYANLVSASKISLTVHSSTERETAVFNHGHVTVSDEKSGNNISRYRITHNDVHHPSHLYADKENGNIFIIKANIYDDQKVILPKVKIYDYASSNNFASVNMIDLRHLAAQINRMDDFGLKVKVDHRKHEHQCRHIHLLLYTFRTNDSQYQFLGEIEIHNGLNENIYHKFVVINRGENLFVPTKHACNLRLKPLPMIMPDKDLTIIAPGQLEENSRLIFRQPVEKVRVFRTNDTLIITNLLSVLKSNGRTNAKPLSIVFLHFFKYEWIFDTISVNFGLASELKLSRIFRPHNKVKNVDHMWSLITKILSS